jgi:hypothetical protein
MTGVLPFLFFHKHTIITIKDATLMSQSLTSMDAGTQPYNKDALLAMDSEELRSIIKNGLVDAETEDFIDKELYIREQRMCINIYPEPEGDPSY